MTGGWIILLEPELHFGSNVLVPDLAGWRRETSRSDKKKRQDRKDARVRIFNGPDMWVECWRGSRFE